MMMKYFRFLYGETGWCFVHLGEIRDTKTEEHFTFLYLRGVRQHVEQAESEHTLFLCPKRLDMVVLGDTEENSLEALMELLKNTEVGTLICFANLHFANHGMISKVKKVICLSDKETEDRDGAGSYQVEAAGWRFIARCCGNDSVMLAHGLAVNVSEKAGLMKPGEMSESELDSQLENASRHVDLSGSELDSQLENASRHVDLSGSKLDSQLKSAPQYKDCVMGVKIVSEEKRCCCEEEPDGYGCALGCALHQDYDVCNYRRKDAAAYATGTVLFPESYSDLECEEVLRGMKEEFPDIRFFGIPGSITSRGLKSIVEGAARDTGDTEKSSMGGSEPKKKPLMPEYKHYFIGADSELSDETIAAISRSSRYHIPVILEPGEALCCSGLLKYSE